MTGYPSTAYRLARTALPAHRALARCVRAAGPELVCRLLGHRPDVALSTAVGRRTCGRCLNWIGGGR